VKIVATLILLFSGTTLLELSILLELGRRIGTWYTLVLVILTAVVGGTLAKIEGLEVLRRTQDRLTQGILPSDELLHGALILAGALLLLTPGLLTDATGLLLLIRPTRSLVATWLKKWLRGKLERGTVITYTRL